MPSPVLLVYPLKTGVVVGAISLARRICGEREDLQKARNLISTPLHRAWLYLCVVVFAGIVATSVCRASAQAQQAEPATPVVVQPGAPGQPSRTLPPTTKGTLPPRSQADVAFMQGMIVHHAQALEMTALIPSHTENKDLRSLGARINSSQFDEIKMDAEIGSYQEDTDPTRDAPIAEESDLAL